jgi:hypothetical protein
MNKREIGNRDWGTGTGVTSRRDLGSVENSNTHQPACRRYAAFKSLNFKSLNPVPVPQSPVPKLNSNNY